jgi:glutamate synthase (NADPH/NADH) large chain
MASESGVLPIPESKIVRKWRLQPGKMLLIDLEQGRIIDDEELKAAARQRQPYKEWLENCASSSTDLDPWSSRRNRRRSTADQPARSPAGLRLHAGRHQVPDGADGHHRRGAIGSMGNDTPLAVLSDKNKLLYNYFKQLFAQVTNPPIDPIREELVMSWCPSSARARTCSTSRARQRAKRLEVTPADPDQWDDSKRSATSSALEGQVRTKTLDITYPPAWGAEGHGRRAGQRCASAEAVLPGGYNILILSDRADGPDRIPIPALLATGGGAPPPGPQGPAHATGLVVETGEAREVHHFCVLAGYGAEAINPYLAFETLARMHEAQGGSAEAVCRREGDQKNYIKAIGKGILKVMSKMGISTYQSYCGAQIFEAVGLSSELRRQVLHRHRDHHRRHRPSTSPRKPCAATGRLRRRPVWPQRRCSTSAANTPPHARRGAHVDAGRGSPSCSTRCAATVGHLQGIRPARSTTSRERLLTMRGLFEFKFAGQAGAARRGRAGAEIVKRFATGAMSFGSISAARRTDAGHRHEPHRRQEQHRRGRRGSRIASSRSAANGDSQRSAIKQVASGRFGVTTEYLVNADRSRSRWRRAPSPAKAASCPATRSTRLHRPSCATRRRASA